MRTRKLTVVFAAAVLSAVLSIVGCAGFSKTKTYNEGQFTDVPESEWFASSVKSAYEFGIMNGNSATTFNPNGTLTVAEGVTIAARIYETVSGEAIPEKAGTNWYDKYVDYAIAKGLMTSQQFDGYDINIKRFEFAELLSAAAGELPAVNSISSVPDVAQGADYAAAVLKLYNAGILGGNDEYGTFAPYSYLLRSEISAMSVRIADEAMRVKKTLKPSEARAFTDAYSIIENNWGVLNTWDYDNRFDLSGSGASNYINDTSDQQFFSLIREFKPEKEGILRLELFGKVSSNEKGVYIALENSAEERILELTPVGGVWTLIGKNGSASSESKVDINSNAVYAFVIEVDLDKNTAMAVIDNMPTGKVDIAPDAVVDRVVLGTNKVGKGRLEKSYIRLTKNYPLDDTFIATKEGEKPYGWEISGDFATGKIASQQGSEVYSLKANSKAGSVSSAKKSFEKIGTKVALEGYMLFPEKIDGAGISFTSGGEAVFKVETKNGKLYIGDTLLHDYMPNVWQWLYIEADTLTNKAVVKINGKKKAEITFTADYFDGVSVDFAPATDGVMWVDDVKAYPLISHGDYPEYPKVAQSVDYNVGINMCYLWRDVLSGEGWDAVSPFKEFDTYLGFYDEGIVETADWELKWMAEHGIDFMHVCWYCPNSDQTAPVKKMRVSHYALHDGYMNAKYSDLIDFCIMWENSNVDAQNFEQFKEYIWSYWKEHYFSDERYARLDNKAVLTVWSSSNMKKTFGGTNEGVKQAVAFMEAELKEMGYDGLILLYQTQGANGESHYKTLDDMGFDATYGYHWGTKGYSAEHQMNANNANAKTSQNYAHHIPTISVGFNDVGRNNTRDPIITAEDHLIVAQDIKRILAGYNTGTWRDNTLMVSTWNEYSEGTYVMPCEGNEGFSYLENIRKTFTNDTSDHSAIDVKPTKSQIARLERTYHGTHTPIRHYQFEARDVKAGSALAAVITYDMATDGANAWKHDKGIDKYAVEDGVITGVVSNGGGIVTSGAFKPFDATKAPVIKIKAFVGYDCTMTVSFITDKDPVWNDSKKKSLSIAVTDGLEDIIINMSSLKTWKDTITGIKIGFVGTAGRMKIGEVSLNDIVPESEVVPSVKVNGNRLGTIFDIQVAQDGDYIITGEQREYKFYSILRLFYRWDRFTDDGVLTLKTYDEHTYVLKVGSDKVLVDGVEKPLGFTFTLRDGLPVFHMKKLADLLGYKYKMNGAALEIQAASDDEYNVLLSRVDNQWEFNLSGGTDGFSAQNGAISNENDGKLTFTATGSDIAIIRKVDIPSSTYTHVVAGFVCNERMLTDVCQLFFTTKASPSWSADKCISVYYNKEGKKVGDTIEAVFKLSDNPLTNDNITGIRIDPYNANVDLKVDYIRFEKREEISKENELVLVDELTWEFDNEGDTAGWNANNARISASGGYLNGTCTNSDIAIVKNGLNFSTADAQVAVVGVKYDPEFCHKSAEMFFTTTYATGYSADKRIEARYTVPQFTNIGETVEVVFDLTQNPQFYSEVTGIRFDIHGGMYPFSVDYVRFYKKPGYVPRKIPKIVINEATRPTQAVITDVNKVPEGITVLAGADSALSIVPDPENPDEKVYKISCTRDGERYTYLHVYMSFEAGKTYDISYKIYPLQNKNGEDYTNTIIGGNFMYGKDGKAVINHTFEDGGNKSSGQGWIDVKATRTIAEDYNPSTSDHFETWGKPKDGVGVEYLVKDISITLAK